MDTLTVSTPQTIATRAAYASIADRLLATLRATTARAYQQAFRAFAVAAARDPSDYGAVCGAWLRLAERERNGAAQIFVDKMRPVDAASTIHTRVAALQRLLRFAKHFNYASGELTLLDVPAVESDLDIRDADVTEIRRLEAQLASHEHEARRLRDRAMLLMLFPMGIRIGGEAADGRRTGILGLDVEDFRVERDERSILVGMKGKSTRRPFPLLPEVADAVEDWLSFRATMLDPCGPIFVGVDRGGKLSSSRLLQQTVRKMFGVVADRAGLTGRTNPHAFRHAAGTQLARNGASVFEIRDHLGHQSVQTTNRYVADAPARSLAMQEKLRSLVQPPC